jgi:C-terminal processing protease CtpA/Prc
VRLERGESGFGFSLTTGDPFLPARISRIVPGGPADTSKCLCTGDIITNVNGEPVLQKSHEELVRLVSKLNTLTLVVGAMPNKKGSQSNPHVHHVTIARQDNTLGFAVTFTAGGLRVCEISPNGPAEKAGYINVGDVIEEINGLNVRSMDKIDTVKLLESCLQVQLSLKEDSSPLPPKRIGSSATLPMNKQVFIYFYDYY